MSEIKLSDYLAKRLKEVYGADRVFMVSGGGAMHLNDSLGKYISYTCCHHEQACAIAAEGYARVNQKLALVNITTGPGGLNCLNGLFGEWTDSVPVLYISGQVKQSTSLSICKEIPLRQLGDQEVDIISVVKPLTKYAVKLDNPNDIKYVLDKAVYLATTGRKGPCWIDIPINLQAAIIDEDELREFSADSSSFTAENEITLEALKKLQAAERPLIVAGHGIRLSGMKEEFLKLVEKLKIPVVTTFNGMDILDDNNNYYIGRIGTVGQRAGNFALQNADTVLFLGTRNNIRQASYNFENFAKNAFKIVADIDEAELDKPTVVPDMKICTDLKDFIPKILSSAFTLDTKGDWVKFCKNLREKYSYSNRKEYEKKDGVINPYDFTYSLTECMNEGDVLTMANGSACVCTFQNAIVKKNQRFILNSGNASMGYGLPCAIGAWYGVNSADDISNKCSAAFAEKRVICLEGDGSIMMNLQELQTVIHNNLPLKIFVINNNGYSSIRQTQRNFFNGRMTGSGVDSGVSVPDFVKIGEAFGFKTRRIENPKDMKDGIKEVLNSDCAVLCEVVTESEYAFLPKLSAKKLPDGTIVSPSLEDMYPFLEREEFKENMAYDKKFEKYN